MGDGPSGLWNSSDPGGSNHKKMSPELMRPPFPSDKPSELAETVIFNFLPTLE